MILSLEDAQKIDANVTQSDLDAFEQTIRQLTNNHFQNTHIRFKHLDFKGTAITLKSEPLGLMPGDTIQISNSKVNDGLTTIKAITGKEIAVNIEKPFFAFSSQDAFITKIEYPADIRMGVEELIRFKKTMGPKLGIKSESIARMAVTYYDINASDNVEGFPAAKFSFLNKYEKMRWG
ncbi:hypothetical protein DSO10_04540 [Listeria monocytogenes]|uniref:hypothetical protein n=1 Tax=Listeria monocytogenes TaxID=1639 RepID=UPI000F152AEC|nr:hypothetical protein [Listeria monocytogenes]EAG1758613.1 hypothetical protein [Listeria monocytogenes]MCN73770.1 hypothetical protein [Listeria monocytogenes]TYU88930.1 hypothetical protein FZX01_05310 [Listeria monocytogenes]